MAMSSAKLNGCSSSSARALSRVITRVSLSTFSRPCHTQNGTKDECSKHTNTFTNTTQDKTKLTWCTSHTIRSPLASKAPLSGLPPVRAHSVTSPSEEIFTIFPKAVNAYRFPSLSKVKVSKAKKKKKNLQISMTLTRRRLQRVA